ncbi:MAG: tryptophan--tRNA ligase, partial [Patescibacteria group bacterium]
MNIKTTKSEYKTEIFTGIRPTGSLTVANYFGAVKPIIKLQELESGIKPLVFVADLHALTDNEPKDVKKYVNEVVADYIALGVDPNKADLFLQSAIENEIAVLTLLLSRHTNVSELLRVPTLKDKLKNNARPETANALLFLYPVMMAADILIQRAKKVPVGQDQVAHIEFTRELAKDFNKKYGEVFPMPQPLEQKALRILSLKGESKMSKSIPHGALLLSDDAITIAKKIKTAETAFEGKMNDRLESHILIAKGLAKTEKEKQEIDAIIEEHKKGKAVMGQFKQIFTSIAQNFLQEFQARKKEITKDPAFIPSVLEQGAKIAKTNAQETLELVKQA